MQKFDKLSVVGKVFNSWEIVSFAYIKNYTPHYNCKCLECNEIHVVNYQNLKQQKTRMCQTCMIKKIHKGKKYSETTKQKMRGPCNKECNQELLAIDSSRKEGQRGLRINSTINSMKQKAVHRGKSWNITNLEAAKLIIQPCHYCGEKPFDYNGLDRVDNSKGYEIDNVVPCCRYCNSFKLDRTVEEFKAHIIKIYNHLKLGEK